MFISIKDERMTLFDLRCRLRRARVRSCNILGSSRGSRNQGPAHKIVNTMLGLMPEGLLYITCSPVGHIRLAVETRDVCGCANMHTVYRLNIYDICVRRTLS